MAKRLQPDPDCMGHTVGDKLQALGISGVLWLMAERAQILELACEMPTCYCPKGRSWFEKRAWVRPGESRCAPVNRDAGAHGLGEALGRIRGTMQIRRPARDPLPRQG